MDHTVDAALARHRELQDVSASPLLDCQILLAHAMNVSRSWLYTHGDSAIDARAESHFAALMAERMAGEPVGYLIGRQGFWKMDLEVSPATLIPRPETELLVETMLMQFGEAPIRVLDAGTGTAAIAIALAMERPAWQLFASDSSSEALVVAAHNIQTWASGRVWLFRGDWLAAIAPASLDAVVSNPPYIAEGDPHLRDLAHEPEDALVSGADGLNAINSILTQALHCLRPGGLLLLEHGFDQQKATRTLARDLGYIDTESLLDLNHMPRALLARKPQ